MKNTIHWIGVAATVILGAVLAFFRILPVEHEIIFIGALFLLWQGLSYLCGFYRDPRYDRRYQQIWGTLQLLLGVIWLPMSMLTRPDAALWCVLLSVPLLPLHRILLQRFRIT